MSRADRRIRLQLAWRSLRWRMGATLVMLSVAAIGIAAATFGPIFLSGADQSVLQTTLRGESPADIGLTLLADNDSVGPTQLQQAATAAPRASNGHPLYGPMIVTADDSIVATNNSTRQGYSTDLISRTGMCGHLTFVTGTCPRSGLDVALTNRSARAMGLRVGDRTSVRIPADHTSLKLTVSGIFLPGNPQAPIWWGEDYFGYGQGGSPSQPPLDDFVTTSGTMLAIAAPGRTPLLGELPLQSGDLSPGNIGRFEHDLAQFEARSSEERQIDSSSHVRQALDRAAGDEHTMTTIVAVVLVQLVLLSLLVLYFVAARIGTAREPDVRLAELRGFTYRGRIGVALLEPVAILVAAMPLGLLIAWLAGRIASPHFFPASVTPSIDALALEVAALTFVAGVVATILAARSLVAPGSPVEGRTRSPRSRPVSLALDAVAVAFAIAAFVEVAIAGVSSGARTDPLAALAPGLLALALGIAGSRLLPWACGLIVPMTRHTRWVGTGMASRRVARLPALSRQIVVLALAVGLASFSAIGWAVAGHNRSIRSAFEVGASSVMTVQSRPGVDFLAAVRRADPSGHRAMATVIENSSDGETLAVDSPRLAAVASWPADLTKQGVAEIARSLVRAKAPPVTLSGSGLGISIDETGAVTPEPYLSATVFDNAYESDTTLEFGTLVPGQHEYRASTAGACSSSCQLVGLGLTWTPAGALPGETVTLSLDVTAITTESPAETWTAVPARLDRPSDWVSASGGVHLTRATSGLAVRATLYADGSMSAFGPDDVPSALPAVVVGAASPGSGGNLAVGLDGATINVRPVASVNALPEVGTNATMVDLTLAQRLQSGPMIYTTEQVWLSPGPTRNIVRRLRSQGIHPISVRTATAQDAALSRSGISLAYDFFLLAAVAAALLAVGSTVFAVVAAARRREPELASLRSVGVGPASLRRSLVIEHGAIIGSGVALGAIGGIVTALVALPSIPEFVSSAAGPALEYRLPLAPLGVMLLAIILSLAVTVGLSARLLIRHSTADKLRGDAS